MKPIHLIIALSAVLIWGFNFVVIKIGLNEMQPLEFCTIRFIIASIPAIFLIKRPAAPLISVVLYGLIMFALQFSLLFIGMLEGISAGLASLLLQLQVFFTILLAGIFLAEIPDIFQIIGALIAFIGIALVAFNIGGEITWTGLALVISAALSWGIANIIAKSMGKINVLSLVIWGSFFAWPPLLLLTIIIEGTHQVITSFINLSWVSVLAILYNAFPTTLFGFGVWNWLLGKYPAATIAPFTLLVPVFGFIGAVFFLGEPMHRWKIITALFIVVGLCINIFGPKLLARQKLSKI